MPVDGNVTLSSAPDDPSQDECASDGPEPRRDDDETPLERWRRDLVHALQILTRIPIGQSGPANAVERVRSMRAFGAVGFLLGLLAAIVYGLAHWLGLPALAAAFLALGAVTIATGALHEDGLADCADGLGGGRDRAHCLAIMRDHQIGSFGTVALILSFGLRAAALADLGAVFGALALIAANAFSRGLLPLVTTLPPARPDGLGSSYAAAPASVLWHSVIIGVGIALIFAGPVEVLVAGGLAALGMRWLTHLALRRIGGFTGDVLGAAQQVAETIMLLGLAALW